MKKRFNLTNTFTQNVTKINIANATEIEAAANKTNNFIIKQFQQYLPFNRNKNHLNTNKTTLNC